MTPSLALRFPAAHAVLEHLEHDPDRGTVMAGTRARQLDPDHATRYAGTVTVIPRPHAPGLVRLLGSTMADGPVLTADARAKRADEARRRRYRQSLGRPRPHLRLLSALNGALSPAPRRASGA